MFGTEIHDDEIGALWGPLRCLYRGAPIGTLAGLRGGPGRVIRAFQVLPGVRYDILGALIAALERADYRMDQTMHLYSYYWRLRAVELGFALAAEVRAVRRRRIWIRPRAASTWSLHCENLYRQLPGSGRTRWTKSW